MTAQKQWLEKSRNNIMEFDLSVYIQAAVSGVPLLFVVIGLVWWYGKAFDLAGRWQFISSMLTGLVLGIPYMILQAQPPSVSVAGWWPSFGYWFGVIVYGLGLGVFASALYEVAKDLIIKIISKYLAHIPS